MFGKIAWVLQQWVELVETTHSYWALQQGFFIGLGFDNTTGWVKFKKHKVVFSKLTDTDKVLGYTGNMKKIIERVLC